MQRRYRLRESKDFLRLRQDGQVYRHRQMLLSLLPNGLSHNRYGVITTKNVGKAVVRNRVRRLTHEVVRLLHPRLRVGYDIVLIPRSGLVGQPFVIVNDVVNELCRQAGILVEYEP
jgi:ribonuclease P protein component